MGKQSPNQTVACPGSAGVALDHRLKAAHFQVEVESSAKIFARDITIFWWTGSPAQAPSSDSFIRPTFCPFLKVPGGRKHPFCVQPIGSSRALCVEAAVLWDVPGCDVDEDTKGTMSHKILGHKDAATTYSSEGWLCKEETCLQPNAMDSSTK